MKWVIGTVVVLGFTWMFWPDGESLEVPEPMIEVSEQATNVATPPVVDDVIEVPVPLEKIEEVAVVIEPEPIVTKPNEPVKIAQPIPLAATTSVNLEEGMQLLDQGDVVGARQYLSNSLMSGMLSEQEAAQARGVLTDVSDSLVFAPSIVQGDPYSIEYIIRSGDTLSGIVHKMGLQVDWRFIQRINGIKQASAIRPGQNLKLVTGPFHAIVHKDTYRIDLYLGEDDEKVYVRSYRVGLGEYDSTPLGLFEVRQHSKLVNPTWINPRTREFYSADNPDNPIGERWIGLRGIDERTKDLSGLGIHGTIEPQTIGTQSSMGCIRMHSADVSQVYEMLAEGVSTVEIR